MTGKSPDSGIDIDPMNNQQREPASPKQKLSFLFVSSDRYPPFRVDTTVLFGEEMTARGHRIDWLLQSEKACEHDYETTWNENRVWVGRTDLGLTRFRRVRKHILALAHQLRLLFRLVRDNRYNFIQIKDKYVIALAALLISKLYRTKFIFWLSYPHGEENLFKVREGIARYPIIYLIKGHALAFLTYKIIMPLASHVFVQSEQMKKDIVGKGLPEEKLTPVPMGVSLKEFEPYKSAEIPGLVEGTRGQKAIVYLGTLQSARKMEFMVRVLKRVLQEEPEAFLYFVGDGDDANDREVLERAAANLGISDFIKITGFMPRSDAMAYVRNADVCVSPFFPDPILNSTSPTKIVEYWAMEKAVVANDHPEQKLMIEESGGGICVPYDEAAFAEAILRLFRNPDQAAAMGIRGRRYVEEFRDYVKIADLVENKYYEILAARSSTP